MKAIWVKYCRAPSEHIPEAGIYGKLFLRSVRPVSENRHGRQAADCRLRKSAAGIRGGKSGYLGTDQRRYCDDVSGRRRSGPPMYISRWMRREPPDRRAAGRGYPAARLEKTRIPHRRLRYADRCRTFWGIEALPVRLPRWRRCRCQYHGSDYQSSLIGNRKEWIRHDRRNHVRRFNEGKNSADLEKTEPVNGRRFVPG